MPDVFVSPDEKLDAKVPGLVSNNVPETEAERKKFKKHSHSHFSSFNLYPDRVKFETKEDEEKIILMLRQHPIVNLKWIFITILLIIFPLIFQLTGLLSLLPAGYQIVTVMAWYLVTSAYAIEGFFGWYFNVFFITTRRVMDVDFFNLINKRVSDAEIEKIQDVSYSTSGALGTTLNYGDVLIQTASEIQELSFERVPNPERVAKILDDLRVNVH